MASGQERYEEAERLITMARWACPDDLYGGYTETRAAVILAGAQVHAAPALAAATALAKR